MSRPAKDKQLLAIAEKLKGFAFPWADSIRVTTERRGVTEYPGGKMFGVRLPGTMMVVGKTANEETALRFADAVAIYFWPWRSKGRAFDVTKLNYTHKQVETDTQISAVKTLLQEIEDHLVLTGVLVPREQIGTATAPVREQLPTTVEIFALLKTIQADVREIRQRLTPNPDWVTPIEALEAKVAVVGIGHDSTAVQIMRAMEKRPAMDVIVIDPPKPLANEPTSEALKSLFG